MYFPPFPIYLRDVAQPGLARLTGGQKVASSNLAVPTILKLLQSNELQGLFFSIVKPNFATVKAKFFIMVVALSARMRRTFHAY